LERLITYLHPLLSFGKKKVRQRKPIGEKVSLICDTSYAPQNYIQKKETKTKRTNMVKSLTHLRYVLRPAKLNSEKRKQDKENQYGKKSNSSEVSASPGAASEKNKDQYMR